MNIFDAGTYGTKFHHWRTAPLAFAEVVQIFWLAHFIRYIAEYLLVIEYFFSYSGAAFDDILPMVTRKIGKAWAARLSVHYHAIASQTD